MTAAWIGGTQATVAFPDFSGVSGWLDSWLPSSGTTVEWNVSALGGPVSGSLCTEGRRSAVATVRGTN